MTKVRPFLMGVPSREIIDLLKRQTLGFKEDIYKGLEFVTDDSYEHAIFLDRVFTDEIITDSSKNVCFLLEPPEIYRPQNRNLHLIDRYYSFNENDRNILGNKFRFLQMQNILQTTILHDDSLLPGKKEKVLSTVVSGKVKTNFQKRRIKLVKWLLKRTTIDVFGRDFERHEEGNESIKGPLPYMDKSSALQAYQYSLALENSAHMHYLSEKFFDCIVNNCMPITNNKTPFKYFPKEGFHYIDFEQNIKDIINQIKKICSTPPTAENDAAILEIKENVLSGDWCLTENIFRAVTGKI